MMMKINLFTTYFISENKDRQRELDYAIVKNVDFFDTVNVIADSLDASKLKGMLTFKSKAEVRYFEKEGKPTFDDFFGIIAQVGKEDEINIIANSDIVFSKGEDYSLYFNWLKEYPQSCLALSRWDYNKQSHQFEHFNRADSQDVWVFYGVPKGINGNFEIGTAGCIFKDAKVLIKRGKRTGGRIISIEDLYKKYNNIKINKVGFLKKDIETYIQSFDTKSGKIFYNKILAVMASGVKKVVKITFEDSSYLCLTPDHKVLKSDGNYAMSFELKLGDTIICKADMKPISKDGKKIYRKRKVTYVKYHPYAEIKKVNGYKYLRVTNHRLSYEAKMNNMTFDEFVYILNNNELESKKLNYLSPKNEVHHIDGNTLNNNPDNLAIFSKSEHARHHGYERGFPKNYTLNKKIIGIEYVGEIMTYDISVEPPYNNFIANDVVVHNCDNRLAHEIQAAGYRVLNPSVKFRTFHIHLTEFRTYVGEDGRAKETVPPPYFLVEPY